MSTEVQPTPQEVRRIGCTIPEFMARSAAGERFCVGCGWQPATAFRRAIRIKGQCRACALKRDGKRHNYGGIKLRDMPLPGTAKPGTAGPPASMQDQAAALHRWCKGCSARPVCGFF